MDAAIDFQPTVPTTTPTLAIAGYNKDLGRATFEASANLIMGKIPEVKAFGLEYTKLFIQSDLTLKFENYIFGK